MSTFKTAGLAKKAKEKAAATAFAEQKMLIKEGAELNARAFADEAKRARGHWSYRATKSFGKLSVRAVDDVGRALGGLAKYTAIGTVSLGLVAGTIDHFEDPNPENDPTAVRIVTKGAENIGDVASLVVEYVESDEARQAMNDTLERASDIDRRVNEEIESLIGFNPN